MRKCAKVILVILQLSGNRKQGVTHQFKMFRRVESINKMDTAVTVMRERDGECG